MPYATGYPRNFYFQTDWMYVWVRVPVYGAIKLTLFFLLKKRSWLKINIEPTSIGFFNKSDQILPYEGDISFEYFRFAVDKGHFCQVDVYACIEQLASEGAVPTEGGVIGLKIVRFKKGFPPTGKDQEGVDRLYFLPAKNHKHIVQPVVIG